MLNNTNLVSFTQDLSQDLPNMHVTTDLNAIKAFGEKFGIDVSNVYACAYRYNSKGLRNNTYVVYGVCANHTMDTLLSTPSMWTEVR